MASTEIDELLLPMQGAFEHENWGDQIYEALVAFCVFMRGLRRGEAGDTVEEKFVPYELIGCQVAEALRTSPDVGDFKMSLRSEDFKGWKLCDGRLLTPRETDLLEESGMADSWNQTYLLRLPDAEGRTIAAAGQVASGLPNRAVGTRTGAETHTLTAAEMPKHNHQVRVQNGSNVGDVAGWAGNNNAEFLFGATDRTADYGVHYRTNSPTNANPGMAYSGGSEPHNNFQPTLFAGNLFVYIGE